MPTAKSSSSHNNSILHTQKQTLHLFLSNPSTRTPVTVLYVASFGGALHAAVTTYFYLEIGASEVDIGHLGFIMSVGALLGAPLSGLALDKYGPWIPISITAGACAWGCLWRGIASGLASLRLGVLCTKIYLIYIFRICFILQICLILCLHSPDRCYFAWYWR